MKKGLTLWLALTLFFTAAAKETPWSAWRLAYSEFEKAEKARDQGDYLHAAEGFQKALDLYQSVRKARPDWNQRVILRRIDDCKNELAKVRHFLTPSSTGAAPASAPVLPAEIPVRRAMPPAPPKSESPEMLALRKKADALTLEIQTLRQRENARKNLESEIALLIRDQHLAKEKCALLEEKLRQAEEKNASGTNEAAKKLADQLLQVKIECESLKKELSELQEKLTRAENETEKAVRQRKFAENAVKIAQNDLQRIETETRDLRRSEAENRGKRTELDARIAELESARAELAGDLKTARTELDDAREKLRRSAGDTQNAKDILAAENRTLSGNLAALQAKYDQLNEAFLETKNQFSIQKARAEQMQSIAERSESARQKTDRQKSSLENSIAALRKENADQSETLARQQERLDVLNKNLSEAVRQKELLEERLRQRDASDYHAAADIRTQRERWDAEREKLQTQIGEAQGEIKKITLQKKSVEENLRVMADARDKAIADIAAMQQKIAAAEALEENLAALRSNFTAVQNELKAARAALDIAAAEKKELLLLRTRAAEAETLKSKLSEEQRLNAELAAANADLTIRATEAANFKREVERLRAEVARVEELRSTIDRLQKLNAELAKRRDVEAELAQAKQQLAEMGSLRAENEAVKKSRDEMTRLLAEKENTLAANAVRYRDETAALRAEKERALAAVRKELDELRSFRLEAEKTQTALHEKITKSQKELADARLDAQKAEKLARESEKILAELRQQIGKKQEEIDALAPLPARLEKLQAENRALLDVKASDDDAQAQIVRRQQENLDSLQKNLALAEENVRRLRTENAEKERALADAETRKNDLDSAVKALENFRSVKQEEIGKLQALLEKRQQENETFRQAAEQKERAGKESYAQLLKRAGDAEAKLLALQEQSQRLLEQSRAEVRLARSDAEKMRALNQELLKLKELETQIGLLRTRLAEAERFQAENARLRQLNEELRKENATLNLAVLKPTAERRYEFDSAAALMTSSDVLIATGMRAEQEGKLASAAWNYENALKKSPRNAMAARKLGLLLLRREEYERAAQILALANRLAPDDPEVALGTALACNRCQRYGIALPLVEPMLKAKNPSMDVLLIAAEAYEGSGKRAKAEELLRLARRYFPQEFAPGIALAKFLARTPSGEDEALHLYESLRVAGAPPEPALEIAFAGKLDERRELAAFFTAAAEEAAAKAEWQTVVWYRRQMADLQRDVKAESAQLAFARYMAGDTAAALEELSLHPASIEGELIAALCHLREHDGANFRQSLDRVKHLAGGKAFSLSADWRYLQMEIKKNALTPEGKALLEVLP